MTPGMQATERLEIEPLAAWHAALLFEVLQDTRMYELIPTAPPASVSALEARYRMLEGRSSPDGTEQWLNWAVRWRGGGAYLGRLEATIRQAETALIAYEVAPQHWGQGIGREACQWLVQELVEAYGVCEVRAEVDTRNLASIRLLEALGFELTARKDNADWFKGAASHEYTYCWRPAVAATRRSKQLCVHRRRRSEF